MGIDQCLGDGSRGEAVSLDEDRGLGGVDLFDHGIGAAALGREVNLDGRQGLRGLRRLLGLAGGEEESEEQEDERQTVHQDLPETSMGYWLKRFHFHDPDPNIGAVSKRWWQFSHVGGSVDSIVEDGPRQIRLFSCV